MGKFFETYNEMSEEELNKIARFEIHQLIPEAIEDLTMVLKAKKMDGYLVTKAQILTKKYSYDELYHISEKIWAGKCPRCHANAKINGFKIVKRTGCGYFSIEKDELVIGCRTCLLTNAKLAIHWNITLGWWSLSSFFVNPFVIIDSISTYKTIKNKFELLSEDYLEYLKQSLSISFQTDGVLVSDVIDSNAIANNSTTEKYNKLLENLEPVKYYPPIGTIINIGFKFYGRQDYDEDSNSYLTTLYFVFLHIPIFPLMRFRVIGEIPGQVDCVEYKLLGRTRLRKYDKFHIAFSCIIIILIIILNLLNP